MHELIRIDHVDFQFNDTPVLKDLSLRIFPGEFVHIIGPNGGGKTTLLKLMMGFLKPAAGQIKINGKSPSEMKDKMAYVPQVFSFDKLFPITAFEVVLSGRLSKLPWHGRYSQEDRVEAEKALKLVNMDDLATRPIGELSGGQLQRVLIARALASNPQILLLDEPTSCIDHSAQEAISEILEKLKRQLTIVMVTHDLDHVGQHSDRVLCIHGSASEIEAKKVCRHFSMGLYTEQEKVGV